MDTYLSNVFQLNTNSNTGGHAVKQYKIQCNPDSAKC